jgi:glutathione S-transferase
MSVGAPLARAGLRKRFDLTPARYAKTRARLMETIEALSEELGERDYFVGDRFTAADLTSSTMLSPVLAPLPGYGAHMPRLGGEYGELREEVAATPLGRHARRMFERHRAPEPEGWVRA